MERQQAASFDWSLATVTASHRPSDFSRSPQPPQMCCDSSSSDDVIVSFCNQFRTNVFIYSPKGVFNS